MKKIHFAADYAWVEKVPRCGFLFNKGALWVGAHYSPFNRRWCINLIPCITFWVILDGGKTPARAKL